MNKHFSDNSRFKGSRIAITGANGSLGKFLIEEFKKKGAYVVGLTHKKSNNNERTADEYFIWSCGDEEIISSKLSDVDILILNHGINPKGNFDSNENFRSPLCISH